MTNDLDELLAQILQSEQKAHERRTALNSIKQSISNCQSCIHEVREERQSLQGHVVTELQRLNDAELEMKCGASKEIIVKSQVQSLRMQCQDRAKKLEELKLKRIRIHDFFCTDVQEFMMHYDLLSYSNHQREISLKDSIQDLIKRRESLDEKLAEYTHHKGKVQLLREKLENMKEALNTQQSSLRDIQQNLQQEMNRTTALQSEKEHIAGIPQNAPEYIKLRKELERLKDESIVEDYCATLECELQSLEQKVWQKTTSKPHQRQSTPTQSLNCNHHFKRVSRTHPSD